LHDHRLAGAILEEGGGFSAEARFGADNRLQREGGGMKHGIAHALLLSS
jgi:hypothetical protein